MTRESHVYFIYTCHNPLYVIKMHVDIAQHLLCSIYTHVYTPEQPFAHSGLNSWCFAGRLFQVFRTTLAQDVQILSITIVEFLDMRHEASRSDRIRILRCQTAGFCVWLDLF